MKSILVTGGCGYIGSHTVLEMLNKNYDVVVVDNFSNSSYESLRRVQQITGKQVTFYEADIRDEAGMEKIFQAHKFDAVIHFAAFKAVGESNQVPLKYYENNISGTVTLLKVMNKYGVKKIIFSSSATVYGEPERLPLDEFFELYEDLEGDDEECEANTVGGWVTEMYGEIPPIGQVLRYEYLEIKIVKATKQKVLKVRVNALEDDEEIEKAKERD